MVGLQRSLPAVVKTPSGSVTADKVVLASGARLGLVPELRRTIFIIPSHVVATESAPGALDRLGWRAGRPFSDGRTAVHYAQRSSDDRLVFGRGGGRLGFGGRIIPAHFHDAGEIASIVADMRGMLPAARDLSIEWRWGGPLERTQHGSPWVGVLGRHRNVCYGLGYSGNGVSASNLIGRTLASVVLELGDDYARSPLVSEPPAYLPPEPIRSAGARAVRSAIERCEILEDAGRKPDPTLPSAQALPERLDAQGSDAVARGRDGLSPCRQRRRHAEVASARNTHLGDKDHGGDGDATIRLCSRPSTGRPARWYTTPPAGCRRRTSRTVAPQRRPAATWSGSSRS